jgi:hypothetical protein
MRSWERTEDERKLAAFVDGLMVLIRPCALIGFALVLVQLIGPMSDHESQLGAALFDGQQRGGTLLMDEKTKQRAAAPVLAPCAQLNESEGSDVAGTRDLPHCAPNETVHLVNTVHGKTGNRSQGRCPGLAAALGTRTGRLSHMSGDAHDPHASGGGGWSAACGLRCAQCGARPPLVYVYRFLDTAHRQLLAMPSSEPFFDIWHPHSQFISEFVFHRSLLASPFVTADARKASFFFVPFYSRLALSNRSVKALLLRRMEHELRASS